jgi:hypothetical protein
MNDTDLLGPRLDYTAGSTGAEDIFLISPARQ